MGDQSLCCAECGTDLALRQHVAAGVVIGGHALADAEGSISFDARFYDTCFPDYPFTRKTRSRERDGVVFVSYCPG